MEGQGNVVGKVAPDFTLPDHLGNQVQLTAVLKSGPVLLIFYPKDFSMICTKQLCNYRDNMDAFGKVGVHLVGVSPNAAASHSQFAKRYDFKFPLLTDYKGVVSRAYDTSSIFMLNHTSRACFVISAARMILYRYVEPTVLTHRSADELLGILEDLRGNNLI